jgi:hypothetical protein
VSAARRRRTGGRDCLLRRGLDGTCGGGVRLDCAPSPVVARSGRASSARPATAGLRACRPEAETEHSTRVRQKVGA